MTKTPVLYRNSLREWRKPDGTPEYALFYTPDRLKDNKRSPVIDCKNEWPTDAQRLLIAAYIANGGAVIVRFDDLELAIRFFRVAVCGDRSPG
jgi:hypothetical protein